MDKLTGYVLDVSPVKNAKNGRKKYFTARFQHSKDDHNRLVCLSPEKHAILKNAEISDDPITPVDAIMTPASDGRNDIKLTKLSSVQTATKKLNFSKTYQAQILAPAEDRKPKTIEELKDEHETDDVNVQFLKYTEERQVNTKYGPTKIIIGVIADKTECRKLVLWNTKLKMQLEEGNFYKLTNLQNRVFDSKPQLNTTSATIILKITAFEGVVPNLQEPGLVTCKAYMVSANASESYICSVCKKPMNNKYFSKSDRITKCPLCNYKQLTCAMVKNQSLHVILNYEDGTTQKCSIQHDVIMKYLSSINKQQQSDDIDALEDFLIIQKEFKICKNKDGDQISVLENYQNETNKKQILKSESHKTKHYSCS